MTITVLSGYTDKPWYQNQGNDFHQIQNQEAGHGAGGGAEDTATNQLKHQRIEIETSQIGS